MTRSRSAAIALRWSMSAVFAFWAFASSAPAQPAEPAKPTSIDGVYNGSCPGEKGPIKFKLSLTQQGKDVVGVFTWYLPEDSGMHAYTCEVGGAFSPANGMVRVFSGKWETPLPGGFNLRGLDGVFDPDGGNGAGQISGDMLVPRRGPKFQAIRDAGESAKMAGAIAGKKEPGPPAVDVAQQTRQQRAVPKPAAAPSSPAPKSDTASITAIDGVYNGSYAGKKGPVKFKLSLTQPDDGGLTGVLTLYLPEGSGTKAFTCDVRGHTLANRTFVLACVRGETPPPAGLDVTGLSGLFDRGGGLSGLFDPAGGNGAGQISGKIGPWPSLKFEAMRDAAESAKIAAAIEAAKTPAERASGPTAINGVYTGKFMRNGNFDLKFSIKSTEDGSLTGLFTFDLPDHKGSSVTYKLTGRYDAGAHDEHGNRLEPFRFTTVEPMGSLALDRNPFTHTAYDASKVKEVHVDITALGSISGSVTGLDYRHNVDNLGNLVATRDRTESANLDKVMAAQLGAASPEAIAAAEAKAAQLSGIEGVYSGSYADAHGLRNKFKLLITRQDIRQDDNALAGVVTFDLPEGSSTKAYAFEFTGTYDPAGRRIDLRCSKWETDPPSNWSSWSSRFRLITDGVFDPNGGNGAGQISGGLNYPSEYKFQVIRDAAESANMASARLRTHNLRPNIEGVFNGTYTRDSNPDRLHSHVRKNEPPAKFKLTITHARYNGSVTGISGLAGVATIYLPTDSGIKAYTYSLNGIEQTGGRFDLSAGDWETVPPKVFQNFKGMGFNGRFVPDMTHYAARITSVEVDDVLASGFVPKFEATWDPTESANIKGTIAAQKAVRDEDQVAALKARAEIIKNAPPKQLAAKGLVRKSQAYWNGYRWDFIRQIFDGGFADDVNDDWSFQTMFTTYVDLFSKNCSTDLPANHHPITIVTTTYSNGQVVKTERKTVDIDPRFIKKYCEFSGVEPDPGSAEAADLAAKNVHTFRRIMQAGSPAGRESNGDAIIRLRVGLAHAGDVERDLDKFFATETGSSAAMRQLGENLLRGATGEPSLQEAGAKIDGAEAETDKDVPPGRFTHLIDAANVFCRDPANAGLRSKYDTTLYMLLAEKYRGVMTFEEEYYYANDFAGRFRDGITGPRSTDAAWPRLHPAFEECLKELGR